VHSHIAHLQGMLARAAEEGVKTVRIHALIDGRDVPPTSALEYVRPFEAFLAELNASKGVDYAIASGGGRMNITMDRYEANWSMVERGWATHVRGEGRMFASAEAAIETFRAEAPGVLDQDLPAFVIGRDGRPLGPIVDGDGVVLFNFRGDRAIELTRAFEEGDGFAGFDRGKRPDVLFAGMMQYDGDAGVPARFLVEPPRITRTIGEYLADAGVRQLAISETQKYGHVTYFFNGNRAEKFSEELEDYVEVPSDIVPFEERPWMKSAEITDKLLEAIASGRYGFIRVNYPNGDMVGHTGVFDAVHVAMEVGGFGAGAAAAGGGEGGRHPGRQRGPRQQRRHVRARERRLRQGGRGRQAEGAHGAFAESGAGDRLGAGARRAGPAGGRRGRLGISSLTATCLNLMGFATPDGYDRPIVKLG